MARLISSIYERGPSEYDEPRRRQSVAENRRRAWQERGIAMIEVDELLDDWERQMVTNIANRIHGRRRV